MRARQIEVALVLVLVVAGLASAHRARTGTYCPGVYSEFVRLAQLETLHESQAAAADDGVPGLGWLDDEEEAAIVARAAGLQLVLDNRRCFGVGDVARARARLPVVQAELADHRAGPAARST